MEQIEDQLQVLKAEFDHLTKAANRASWRGMLGEPTRFLALHVRAADLIVAGSPNNTDVSLLRTIHAGELVLSAAGRSFLHRKHIGRWLPKTS